MRVPGWACSLVSSSAAVDAPSLASTAAHFCVFVFLGFVLLEEEGRVIEGSDGPWRSLVYTWWLRRYLSPFAGVVCFFLNSTGNYLSFPRGAFVLFLTFMVLFYHCYLAYYLLPLIS